MPDHEILRKHACPHVPGNTQAAAHRARIGRRRVPVRARRPVRPLFALPAEASLDDGDGLARTGAPETGVLRDRMVVTALRRWYAQQMPIRAALVTALITERPLCMACISERTLAPVEEVRALFPRNEEVLHVQRIASERCHACGLMGVVFFVKRPAP